MVFHPILREMSPVTPLSPATRTGQKTHRSRGRGGLKRVGNIVDVIRKIAFTALTVGVDGFSGRVNPGSSAARPTLDYEA